MKAKILFISLLTMYTLTSYSKSPVKKSDKIVYICDGPKAKVYHSSPNCRGLNRCSGDIVKITMSKAKEMGRRGGFSMKKALAFSGSILYSLSELSTLILHNPK